MTASLIIPTYNPTKRIVGTINSAGNQSTPFDEIIIVENGSSTEWLMDGCNDIAFYNHSSVAGANSARNLGAEIASGDLLVFTDDDCELDRDFLTQHLLAHNRYPNSVIGGQVVLRFEEECPDWLRQPFLKSLAEVDWHKQLGSHTAHADILVDGLLYLVTANMSVRKSTFVKAGMFDETAGYIGDRRTANDEHGFLDRARQVGHTYYSSLPVVHHNVPRSRTSIEYFKDRFWGQGYADAMLLEKQLGNKDHAIHACLDDIYRKGSVSHQLDNEKFDPETDKDIAMEFSRNLYICMAHYNRGVLDYFGQ